MIHRQHTPSTRSAVRQRREWVLGVIAGTTLVLSWSLSAALDARPYPQENRRSAISEFDAAFLAANAGSVVESLPCAGADCSPRLAQADELHARL